MRRRSPLALALFLALGCSPAATPKPLPGGPPPEYEPPRAFDLGAHSTPAATSKVPAPRSPD